jgi:tetratricopeptide (TPR) repeat protein
VATQGSEEEIVVGRRSELTLNSIYLKNRIAELGIKQWWLAEQVGVDRKTVIRWIQGKVKSIQTDNVEALAKILNCDVAELTLSNEADQLASIEDQKSAAQLLASSSLIEKLGPIGEWDVIESLLKATIVPNLPTNILGELYNQLTVASWRQSKIDQADIYNKKAEDLARRSKDKSVLAGALLSKANLFSWRGMTSKAINTYRECLALEPFIEPKTLGSTYSNLGAVLYESGDLVAGEEFQKKALDVFTFHGKPMNHSIAWCHLAMIYLQMEQLDKAKAASEKALLLAQADDYRRGIEMDKLIKAEICVRSEQNEDAERHLRSGLEGFAKLGIEEGLNYEYAGRVSRLLKKLSESEHHLRKGIALSKEFPLYQASLFYELARTLAVSEKQIEAVTSAKTAIDLYSRCEAPIRVEMTNQLLKSIA